MKLLVFASVLLTGFGAAAQNNAPNWLDPSTTQGLSSKQNSVLCYAIRMFKVGPEEKVQPYLEAHAKPPVYLLIAIAPNIYRIQPIPRK